MSRPNLFKSCLKALRNRSFHSAYHSTFSVVEADCCELKSLARRLRHEIFGAAETRAAVDEARAVDHLLIHQPSGEAIGTVRVLLPNKEQPLLSFPVQTMCEHPYLHETMNTGQFCELASLGIIQRFRKRPGDGRFLPSYHDQDWRVQFRAGGISYLRRRIPYAPLGLLQAAFRTALNAGIVDCVMMMESAHREQLERIGLPYRVLGPKIEYQGVEQQPLQFNIKHALDHMLLENPNCWDVVADMGSVHKKANLLYLDATRETPLEALVEMRRMFDENMRAN
jgi:N-acyl amino acid synthase of PEP-CTERM/exosortase system